MEKFNDYVINAISNYSGTCVLTYQDCEKLLNTYIGDRVRIDTSKFTNDCNYAFIVLNAWCYRFTDLTGLDATILATRIKAIGLANAIAEADQHRLWLVNPNNADLCPSQWWLGFHLTELCFENLDFLGYPKRLKLESRDNSEMYKEYINGNLKCSRFNCKFFSTIGDQDYDTWLVDNPTACGYVIDSIKSIITLMFKDWAQDESLFTLPPGTSFEGCNTYFEKFKYVIAQQQWLRERDVNIPSLTVVTQLPHTPSDVNRYSIVPKNFKTGRGIAPEPVSRQVLGYQVDAGMRRCLKRFHIDLDDQNRNRVFCGDAYHKRYATVDMSSASDSISATFVRSVFADVPKLLSKLEDCRTNYIMVNNRYYVNHRFATMGNSITFALESAIFAALAVQSVHLVYPRWSTKRCFESIAVYGDDVILPVDAYDVYVQLATRCGFVVNKEKSYSHFDNGAYRESCGVESITFDNTTVTREVTKWPRGTSTVLVGELSAQQHKAAEEHLVNTDFFLTSVILELMPNIKMRKIGTPSLDLWSDFPLDEDLKRYSPYMTIEHIRYGELNITENKWLKNPWFTNFVIGIPKPMIKREPIGKFFVIWNGEGDDPRLRYKLIHNLDVTRFHSYPTPITDEDGDNSYDLESDYEVRTFISSAPGGKIPEDQEWLVDILAYYLRLGGGIEHINGSEYTKEENMVFDRRDLYFERKIVIKSKLTLK